MFDGSWFVFICIKFGLCMLHRDGYEPFVVERHRHIGLQKKVSLRDVDACDVRECFVQVPAT